MDIMTIFALSLAFVVTLVNAKSIGSSLNHGEWLLVWIIIYMAVISLVLVFYNLAKFVGTTPDETSSPIIVTHTGVPKEVVIPVQVVTPSIPIVARKVVTPLIPIVARKVVVTSRVVKPPMFPKSDSSLRGDPMEEDEGTDSVSHVSLKDREPVPMATSVESRMMKAFDTGSDGSLRSILSTDSKRSNKPGSPAKVVYSKKTTTTTRTTSSSTLR